MATRDPGADPLQQFIAQFMTLRQFTEQQRQFGAQQALLQRQVENEEIKQFATLAQSVESPEQREALAQQFAMRVPHMAETFANLALAIPVSEQVYRARLVREGLDTVDAGEVASVALTGQTAGQLATSSAQASRDPEDIVLGLRTQEGQELTAGQRQQGGQFTAQLMESMRQFGIDTGLRERGLTLQEFATTQQGELGRMSTMFGAGFGGHLLRNEQAQMLREVQNELLRPVLGPERRRELLERQAELQGSITELNQWIGAQMSEGGGSGARGMSLGQLLEAEATAFDDVMEATSPGEKETATQRFNYIRALLQGGNPPPPQSMLDQEQNWYQSILGRTGESVSTPFNLQGTTMPFLPGGAR